MLEVRDACFWYRKSAPPIVYKCNLSLSKGEFVAVIGESGGGKTTLLRLCCGLLQLQMSRHRECGYHVEGEVMFRGKSLERPDATFAYVPQNFHASLHPARSARDNVLMTVLEDGISHVEEARAAELMSFCGISDVAHMNVRRLSGGQQQRASICRALMKTPSVIFMDEPFANLDPSLKPSMAHLLDNWRKRSGLSLLLVTHDIDGAILLADKIVGIKPGYGVPSLTDWTVRDWDRHDLKNTVESWIADRK